MSNYLIHYNDKHDPKTGQFARKNGGGAIGGKTTKEMQDAIKRQSTMDAYADKVAFHRVNRINKTSDTVSKNTSKITNSIADMVERPKVKKKTDVSKISDAELKARIERLQLEQRYLSMADKPTVSAGRQRTANFLRDTGNAVRIAGTVINTGIAIYKFSRYI